ncbi:uncharacterized protein LOC111598285 [Drosophila hydei]|uniref:Uncharacterized protein LOC111598285 n=1 Tax=Drosophila hydei TaxID=7224 RepID=A0A6J1LNV2_DROHY|nr:uncharacterized protein LOC111598285 [Drosophila hydei]
MGIAETEKRPPRDAFDVKAQKARSRSFLKRRSVQLSTNYLQTNLCTNLQRQWSRRRLRRLFWSDKNCAVDSTRRKDVKPKVWPYSIYSFVPMLLVLGFSFGITVYQNTDIVSKFMLRYTAQYQATVHNKFNYCDRTMPLHDIFENIHDAVINQELALKQLEQALANQSFQPIALVGTSGVGKTLTIRKLIETYPWPENVQTIAWNDYELIDNDARYKAVWKMLRNLAHCGRNLIVIDNMAVCDLDYVTSINGLVLSNSDVANGTNDPDKKLLTIIYVFNVNSMLPEEHYNEQLKMLQQIEATETIVYRMFGPQDLEKCVRHEERLLGLILDEQHFEDMVNTTNVKVSGCKTVRAKVLVHGRPLMNDIDMQSKLEAIPVEGH